MRDKGMSDKNCELNCERCVGIMNVGKGFDDGAYEVRI
jgi:hypothetical protein